MTERRKDNKGRVLRKNEYQRSDASYEFRWYTDGKRNSVYARNLTELREKELKILQDKSEGIRTDATKVTINDIYELWRTLKRGLKENTYQNYQYMYERFVQPSFGLRKITMLKRSDIRRFYNSLIDNNGMKVSTVDNIHTVLHQVLTLAVEDGYLRSNISDNALKELKLSRNLHSEKRKALTIQEQKILLDFLKNNNQYKRWYPILAVMLGTGLRVGEVTGLRWQDINLNEETININHTLVYYSHHSKGGCYFGVNTPKTKAGERIIPMIDTVKEAFLLEKEYQEQTGISCSAKIDGFTDFIFVNRFGYVQHQGTLNKAIRRIIRDCNQEILDKAEEDELKIEETYHKEVLDRLIDTLIENNRLMDLIATRFGIEID